MDIAATLTQIKRLSIDDRIQIVQAIWDSIASDPIDITKEQKAELSRRLVDHLENPSAVVPWETVKAQALSRIK